MQMTLDFCIAAYTIAIAISSSSAFPVASKALTFNNLQVGAIPEIPILLLVTAPIIPATLVPWPCSSSISGSGNAKSPILGIN